MAKPKKDAAADESAEPQQHVPGTVSFEADKPPARMHQREVSAITIFDDSAAVDPNFTPSSLTAPPTPANPRRRHARGISVDLTRRLLMPHKDPEPLLPIPPPRARDVRASTAEGRASVAGKKSAWGAASKLDSKVVGLGAAARYSADYHKEHGKGLSASTASRHKKASVRNLMEKIDEEENTAREEALSNPFGILVIGGIAAVKVFGVYLITLDTMLSISLSIGLTCYWYFTHVSAT